MLQQIILTVQWKQTRELRASHKFIRLYKISWFDYFYEELMIRQKF